METIDLFEFGAWLRSEVSAAGLEIAGPAETEFGIGFDPTISFWLGDRRVHFYLDSLRNDQLTVEVAARSQPAWVLVGSIKSRQAAFRILEQFLTNNADITQLPDCEWLQSSRDQDKFVPHPPDRRSPGNIAQIVPDA